MFSDGFFEQIGGAKGLPFGYARILNLLKEIQGKRFEEQKKCINDEFNAYRGNRETQDDVTVLGFRLTQPDSGQET
jgi:serine phosphatase RsbU (regulator of sigma subunit)